MQNFAHSAVLCTLLRHLWTNQKLGSVCGVDHLEGWRLDPWLLQSECWSTFGQDTEPLIAPNFCSISLWMCVCLCLISMEAHVWMLTWIVKRDEWVKDEKGATCLQPFCQLLCKPNYCRKAMTGQSLLRGVFFTKMQLHFAAFWYGRRAVPLESSGFVGLIALVRLSPYAVQAKSYVNNSDAHK